MVPKAAIWQELRSLALTNVVQGTYLRATDPRSLANWFVGGSYVVAPQGKNAVLLGASDEISSALLGDVSLYLDASVEHSVFIRSVLSSAGWKSAGWTVVTTYYWAFFLATALTRLVGRAAIHIDPDRAKALNQLAAIGVPRITPGPHRSLISPTGSVGESQLLLKRSKAGRVHDLTWLMFKELVEGAMTSSGFKVVRGDEDLLYILIRDSFRVLGHSWPSELRNSTNYVPELGYRSVRRKSACADLSVVNIDPCTSFSESVARMRRNLQGFQATGIRNQSVLTSKLLLDFVMILHSIVSELYCEVLDRRGVDMRWQNLRESFVHTQMAVYRDPNWPLRP